MNKYISSLILASCAVGFTACNDFLDEKPEDKLIPENFFNSEANLKAYTLNLYAMLPSHSNNAYQLGTFSSDNGTDNQASRDASTVWVPGEWRVGSGTQNWSFGNVRSLNYFINNAEPEITAGKVSGSPAGINQALGEAYFLRAYTYYTNYSAVGDWPINDEVLPNDKEFLLEASVRQPRHLVARHILNDLQKAIQLLPQTSSYGKNGITSDCAALLRSRVALFEGTWLKYHKGTALVPGGPGWPGDASLLNGFNIDNEISYFLTEAMASAQIVADKHVDNLVVNTDTPEGMGPGFTELNPYYCMFAVDNSGSYSEVLMYRAYNLNYNQATQIQAQFQKNAGGTGWTQGLVNSFLMRNGLPIYAAGSGYDTNWESQGITATLQNRDSRIQIFTKQDGSIITLGLDGNSPEPYNMNWMFSADNITRCPTGFAIKKGQDYNYKGAQGNLQSTTGSIVFRAAEALLNYMEADVVLNNTVSSKSAAYWTALRNRAMVDPDYGKTVAATDMSQEALGDWGAYSQGELVSPLVYNVRRERRNELIAEGLRMEDLRRWCALDQLAANPYVIKGMKYWNSVYSDPTSPLAIKNAEGEFYVPTVDPASTTSNMSDPSLGDHVRPYQINHVQNLVWDGYSFTTAHYLSPIGHNVFVYASPDLDPANSVVYQNPGWPIEADQGANPVN